MEKIKFDVDTVYCISIKERQDRRDLFEKAVGCLLENPVTFYIVERNDDPVRGCFESHQALAKMALANGLQRILIFEDDVKPYQLKPAQIGWTNRFIRTRPFKALHLGYSMGRTWLTWFPFIARGRVVALHAYILSREGCRAVAEARYDGTPIDRLFRNHIKQYCAFPMLFRQHAAYETGSDIEGASKDEDEWWERNWDRHKRSPIKNFWRTLFRLNF
ncbi:MULTISPECIES: glycosyltransferase family 25 protein [Pseudomonas]|uniref:hypothetical protein n=1 Tax=Pseudomonas TaxID=286 RepID=UPI0005C1727A|nr:MULTISPECIES: hypothetical protein [Pseudomonas]KIU54020.1 hypothetical protein QV12_02790 [Pseudomonas putida]MCP8346912.1 hypothetical protein [Pseudomonas sp. FBF18]